MKSSPLANSVLRDGPNHLMNACVGENGGPYDFGDYALGFFKAANSLIELAREVPEQVDMTVYPVAYLYRHGTELYLKHFAALADRALEQCQQAPKGHDIKKLWTDLKPKLHSLPQWMTKDFSLPLVDEIINDFAAFDPNGEVFRYPESKQGDFSISGFQCINLDILRERMRELETFFTELGYNFEGRLEFLEKPKWSTKK
jgi:hypothetical protein